MRNTAPQAGVRRALNQKQLVVFYQPIHELDSRKIVAAEALLRARRRSGEIRSAVPIAHAAEEGSQMFRLDSWMMQQAFTDSATWNGVRLNINLSPREFEEGHLVERLKKLGDVSRINLEITETSYIEHPNKLHGVTDAIRELGVELWLDDFGTGHSSLSHLLNLEVDGVKIPATFVKGVEANERSRAITRSIIALAHELGLKVIAEGVENDKQLAFLRDLRCEFIQGFLFSEPMALEEFTSVLSGSSTQ
ncbi:MAG TPA: EAL domain-containing protein [Thermoanaerobaculia bacterium]|nr:EAL domain-containing protein [Thermoanaerobaculia bacterium]